MMYATTKEQTFSFAHLAADRGELERMIQHAFITTLGQEEVINVYVSRFPYEYGAIVLLKNEPLAESEALAIEQEERFRKLGIHLGILVRKVRATTHR